VTRTQVAIVGAGPAGLTLAQILLGEGIESVVLERRSREHVERRIRAGVLEQRTADILTAAGAGERMRAEGIVHHGIGLQFDGERHRIDLTELTGGAGIVIYGQTEVVKDLIRIRLAADGPLLFEVADVRLQDVDGGRPVIAFHHGGAERTLGCDLIAGCDGFHGVSRGAIPAGALSHSEREYPFGWLGILADVPPSHDEVVYANHDRGFALLSLRSPTLSRLYIQCAHDEDIGDWPDERIWEELQARLGTPGWTLHEGPVLEKGITALRSFVVEPMQYGNLFLAGDAAHIVPPTGAKGMNLAIADVALLAEAIVAWYRTGSRDLLDVYSEACLRRVWRAEHFSWWMTMMMHRLPGGDPFDRRLQRSQFRYVVSSRAASASLAENYVGFAPG
jgi:p-hydroxybenzoate 3-monooxygenase